MIDGRVVASGRDLGSGFCLTDRIVATAAHVVRERTARDLAFVTASGVEVPVEVLNRDVTIDVALLQVAESLAIVPPLSHATESARWRVTARPEGAAAQLTGLVSATDHLVINAGGHEMSVLQLSVSEVLKDYGGYSGSAVVVDGSVVGILVEQVNERRANAGGARLASNVLYAVPVERVVRRFRLGVPVSRPEGPLSVQRLLDTAYFDLDRLKTAILEAKSAADDRLLAFGLNCTDAEVAANLCSWLPPYIGQVAQKPQLSVKAEVRSIDSAVLHVTRYRAVLERMNVVCPVVVDGVPSALVTELWDRIREGCAGMPRWLVLFFVGMPDGGYPDGVTALPQPSFAHRDVASWAAHVVTSRKWPSSLATVLRDRIVRQATLNDDLNIRFTYDVLSEFIDRVRQEPDQLRSDLEDLQPGDEAGPDNEERPC